MLEQYMTLGEVAAGIGSNKSVVRYHIRNGNLPARRFGRQWIIHIAAYQRWAASKSLHTRGRKPNQEKQPYSMLHNWTIPTRSVAAKLVRELPGTEPESIRVFIETSWESILAQYARVVIEGNPPASYTQRITHQMQRRLMRYLREAVAK